MSSVKNALSRFANGDYDELLKLATKYNTPEAQRLFAEAVAAERGCQREAIENIVRFLKEFDEKRANPENWDLDCSG